MMLEFFGVRSSEAVDATTLGINPIHHVPNRSVFASRIHALQDDQKTLAIRGKQLVLSFLKRRVVGTQRFDSVLFLQQFVPGLGR